MTTATLINIIGTLAAICMICGYVPQAWYTIRTRDTDGIALPTFLAMGLGSVFFIIQGILMGVPGIALAVTNTITAAASIVITVIKLQNDHRKSKHQTAQ